MHVDEIKSAKSDVAALTGYLSFVTAYSTAASGKQAASVVNVV
jgi:hypothetical protein